MQYFKGVPSPVKRPEAVNMVIFRENTEDIYAGIEFEAGKDAAIKGPRIGRKTRAKKHRRTGQRQGAQTRGQQPAGKGSRGHEAACSKAICLPSGCQPLYWSGRVESGGRKLNP